MHHCERKKNTAFAFQKFSLKKVVAVSWWLICVQLVTPWTVAHQTPLSVGSPKQNTGVGCHFPSSVAKSCPALLWPHGLQLNKLLCPWDLSDKNTGIGCHFLLQGVFPTQGSNPCLRHYRQILYHWGTGEAPSRHAINKYRNVWEFLSFQPRGIEAEIKENAKMYF